MYTLVKFILHSFIFYFLNSNFKIKSKSKSKIKFCIQYLLSNTVGQWHDYTAISFKSNLGVVHLIKNIISTLEQYRTD